MNLNRICVMGHGESPENALEQLHADLGLEQTEEWTGTVCDKTNPVVFELPVRVSSSKFIDMMEAMPNKPHQIPKEHKEVIQKACMLFDDWGGNDIVCLPLQGSELVSAKETMRIKGSHSRVYVFVGTTSK